MAIRMYIKPVTSFLVACVLGLVVLRTNQGQSRDLRVSRELVFGMGKVNLRVAAFGSSNTWGAGLASRFDAYPYLLSPEVDNYASFAAGPNYQSVCTNTVVGDDNMYDVILLEYWLRASEGLGQLSKRLRQRFPRAIMIFVRLANPIQVRRKDFETDQEPGISFTQWKSQQYLPLGQLNELIEAVDSDTGYWYFPDHQIADAVVNTAARDTGGYQFKIPSFDTDKESLMYYLRFFDKTHHALLNERGHELIANITRDIVTAHVPKDEETLVDSAKYGTWGRGDKCHLWVNTGGCTYAYSPQLVMEEFDKKRGRFGLEVRSEGWIDVKNPFDDDRALYVSFMAHNSTVYPEVKLAYGDFEQIMNPISYFDRNDAGVTRTIPAGVFPPGTHRVTLTPLLNRAYETPFRLVGITFTNGAVPSEYGFGPEFN